MVFPDSSSITSPLLLHKRTRSEGPSLRRRYPASSVPLALSDSRSGRCPSQRRWSRYLHQFRVSLNYLDRLPYMPRPLPRRTGPVLIGFFPDRAAFPVEQKGRRPHLHFRGLLRLHSRCGLQGCSSTQSGLCHEASIRPVTWPDRPSATKAYR